MFHGTNGLRRRWVAVVIACLSVAGAMGVSFWQWGNLGNSPESRGEIVPQNQGGPDSNKDGSGEIVIGDSTMLIFERRWTQCENVHTRVVPAGEKLAGYTQAVLSSEFPDWQVESFSADRVVLVQSLPGDCPEPAASFTITIRDGQVLVLKGSTLDSPVYMETGVLASDLLPGDRVMLENGVTVQGEERVWAYLEGLTEHFDP